jgi:hypothetical protein
VIRSGRVVDRARGVVFLHGVPSDARTLGIVRAFAGSG